VQVIEVAEDHDLHVWKAVGTVLLGASAVGLRAADDGFRWISEGLALYRGLRTPPIFWPFLLQLKAQACIHAGEVADGLGAVDEALALAPMLPDLHIARGDLLLASGDAAAETAFEQALDLASAWGAHTSELRATIRLVKLAGGHDPTVRDDRSRRLHALVEMLQEGPETNDIREARGLLRADA
jgi:pimeloyl-ACP methyl ester carboxylesterase